MGQSVEIDSLKAQFETEAKRRQETESTIEALRGELNQGETLQAARSEEVKALESRLKERDDVINDIQRKFEAALRESREHQNAREQERGEETQPAMGNAPVS